MDPQNFDVVIAGGGFAGVYCAQALARELGRGHKQRVAIIADENFMVFQPMLAEVTGSSISPRHIVNPIRRLCRGVHVLRGGIEAIDLEKRALTLNGGPYLSNLPVHFDHLVLALGGVIDLSRVPGMPEHGLLMKTVTDAEKLRATIIDRFEEANLGPEPAVRQRLLTFVVVGGGYSGVETAGQIQDLLQDIIDVYPALSPQELRVILVHSGDHLLPEISEKLGRYCEKNLTKRGVEIILKARVGAVTASRVSLQDGRTFESHTVVSTVGNAPHPQILALAHSANLRTEKGRLVTDAEMRVENRPHVWAAGDCAAIPMGDEQYCPPTAQFAMRQGTLLGRNLAWALIGREPEPFNFRGLGELAAIGHRTAVADILGWHFSGFLAWFMWRTIYLSKLPGLERKLRVMIDWTLDLFFPRDITLIRPKITQVVQEMHLEKGDQLFHAGEPALSFYIVKKGRIDLRDANGVVKSLATGEHFGERALLEDKVWRFTAVATEPSTLVALSASVFETISRASSSMHHFFEQSANQYLSRQQIEALAASVPDAAKTRHVAELMTAATISLRADMTVAETLQVMTKYPYNSYPMIAADGTATGFLAQDAVYDALKQGRVTSTGTLVDFPVSAAPTILPEATVPEALERFCRGGTHKMLVTKATGEVVGILSVVDLLAPKAAAPLTN